MDSLKQEFVNAVKGAVDGIVMQQLPGHPDAEVEVVGDGNLEVFVRVTHPTIQGHRQFTIKVQETM